MRFIWVLLGIVIFAIVLYKANELKIDKSNKVAMAAGLEHLFKRCYKAEVVGFTMETIKDLEEITAIEKYKELQAGTNQNDVIASYDSGVIAMQKYINEKADGDIVMVCNAFKQSIPRQ